MLLLLSEKPDLLQYCYDLTFHQNFPILLPPIPGFLFKQLITSYNVFCHNYYRLQFDPQFVCLLVASPCVVNRLFYFFYFFILSGGNGPCLVFAATDKRHLPTAQSLILSCAPSVFQFDVDCAVPRFPNRLWVLLNCRLPFPLHCARKDGPNLDSVEDQVALSYIKNLAHPPLHCFEMMLRNHRKPHIRCKEART